MNHLVVHLKLTQHCNSTILQFKEKKKERVLVNKCIHYGFTHKGCRDRKAEPRWHVMVAPSLSSLNWPRAPILISHPLSYQVGFHILVLVPKDSAVSEDMAGISSDQPLNSDGTWKAEKNIHHISTVANNLNSTNSRTLAAWLSKSFLSFFF